MKNLVYFFSVGLLILITGCATEGPYVPAKRDPSPEIQNTSVILDREIAGMIAADLEDSSMTPQGKLLARVNLRNRTNQDLQVQFQFVFRDEQGFSVNDDTAWEVLTLTANETRGVNATSTTKKAERYTLRIRMMR